MAHSFEQRLAVEWPPQDWQDVTVVVAVSGGADSVALLRALENIRSGDASHLIAAHYNHKLRRESDDEERFVVELCERLGVLCRVGNVLEPLAAEHKGSLEEAARSARYEFLSSVARECGARYVATAHTADDQAETILHRILRGTGLRGLAGIPRVRALAAGVTLIRPLLSQTRQEVIEYLSDQQQDYCSDSSNLDPRFMRNRIRGELLPLLTANYNPRIVNALLRLGELAREASDLVEDQAQRLLVREATFTESSVELSCGDLSEQHPLVVRAMLRLIWRRQGWPEQAMSYEKWSELAELALGTRGTSVDLPGRIRAQKSSSTLTLTEAIAPPASGSYAARGPD